MRFLKQWVNNYYVCLITSILQNYKHNEYIKHLSIFPLRVSCSEFAGTTLQAPLDGLNVVHVERRPPHEFYGSSPMLETSVSGLPSNIIEA
jgi:hypothetical protein